MQYPIEQNDPVRFSLEKESRYFDRKSARKDANEISKHISAFANASGGKLVIGIEDNGEVTGFKRSGAHDVADFLQAPITCCDPVPVVKPIEVDVVNSRGENDRILVLDVQASTDRVIARRRDGEVFLRQNDESVRLTREQIRALEYDKNQRRFEDEIADRSSVTDIDQDVMNRYREELGTNAPCEQILRSRGMLVDGHLTNAGVLLFARNPTQFIPCARVRVMRFDGNRMETGRRLNIVKDKTFDGPLPRVIEGARQLISSQLREFQYLDDDGKFKIIPEYPEFAWFEGLVNAVTHRNYAHSGDYIRVMMYDDRLEILSPGKLPNIITIENMRRTRWSRNPVVARTLVEFGWVRELNEGVQRIYDEMASLFLHEPVFSEPNDSSVLLTLENSITSRVLRQDDAISSVVDEDAYHSLSELELIAVQLAYGKGRVTVKQLAAHLGRSTKTARMVLRGLVDREVLSWHVSNPNDPSQYYTLPRSH
jgi:ATP-dependent DNA helicase RecG